MAPRRRRLLGLLVCVLGLGGTWPAVSPAAAAASPVTQLTGLAPSQVSTAHACAAPTPGRATCFAQVVVHAGTHTPVHLPRPVPARPSATTAFAAPAAQPAATAAPQPGTAAYLQQAYDLTWLAANAGSGDTVAIVDAFGDPTIASDLSTFRSANGLPACTSTTGCFEVVDQTGGTALPAADPGWDTEQALDVEAVSSLCPRCHILLVQANSDNFSDLQTAAQTAATLGAQQISMSFGGTGGGGTWSFTGVASLAAAGDSGYDGTEAVPATSPGVTAVGGTTLTARTKSARGVAESAWSGTGSGCDTSQATPTWQTGAGCTGRAWNDVSADADPNTGLNIYDTGDGGWEFVGGTSLATPLTAAAEAVTGVDGTSPQWAYTDSGGLNDITSGANGTCPAVCTAGPGYDGPTGNGSISGAVVTGGPGIGGTSASTTTSNSGNLAGGIYPNGLDTTYWWEYGTTTSYGQQTTGQDAGSGSAPVSVSAVLAGLTSGTTYHVRLVADNADGTTYGPDAGLTTTGNPTNLTAPSIAGAAEQTVTLTANPGTWSASTGFSYQWQEALSAAGPFVPIAGATRNRYTPTAADVGYYLQVVVTDHNASTGQATAASAAVGPVVIPPPTATSAPSITGTPTEGQTLTATTGTWTFPGTAGYAWQRSGSGAWTNIAGADSATYTLTAADVGAQVRVVVTETNSTGSTAAPSAGVGPIAAPVVPQLTTAGTATPAPAPAPVSAPTGVTSGPAASAPPAAAPPPPATTTPPPGVVTAPRLEGRARVGARVTLTPARYVNVSGQMVQYYRCTPGCRPVGRAGESSYRLGGADAGAYIRARVTLWGAGGEIAFWVPGLIGPVTSADAGVAGLRLGHRAMLRARRAGRLATAQTAGATAASRGLSGRVRIRLARAGRARGTVTVWACVLRGRELIACTPRRALRARRVLTVSVANGERVQVIALRRP